MAYDASSVALSRPGKSICELLRNEPPLCDITYLLLVLSPESKLEPRAYPLMQQHDNKSSHWQRARDLWADV